MIISRLDKFTEADSRKEVTKGSEECDNMWRIQGKLGWGMNTHCITFLTFLKQKFIIKLLDTKHRGCPTPKFYPTIRFTNCDLPVC